MSISLCETDSNCHLLLIYPGRCQLNSAPADSSISSGDKSQNSKIDGGGNTGPSSPTDQQQLVMDADSGLATNADDATASPSVAHGGVGEMPSIKPETTLKARPIRASPLTHAPSCAASLDASSIPMGQNAPTAPPLISAHSSRAPPNRDAPRPSSGLALRSIPTPPESLSVDEGQPGLPAEAGNPTVSRMNNWAEPAAPDIANGARERFSVAVKWVNSGMEDDAATLVETMLHQGWLSLDRLLKLMQPQLVAEQPLVSRALPQHLLNSSTLNTTPTLWSHINCTAEMPTGPWTGTFLFHPRTRPRQSMAVPSGEAGAATARWRLALAIGSSPKRVSPLGRPGSSAHMASKREASKQNWKSGNCSRCPATQSPLWRRDPETKKQQLCNACGQKARAEQKKREQEHNAPVGEEAAATSLAGSEVRGSSCGQYATKMYPGTEPPGKAYRRPGESQRGTV
ncbi:hypothetical protein B0H13DRAFT_1882423 [Mycena leptocephala]|nr:hypothetical protein B0H13DRAFT_1882423 [Mycena leptocephala]